MITISEEKKEKLIESFINKLKKEIGKQVTTETSNLIKGELRIKLLESNPIKIELTFCIQGKPLFKYGDFTLHNSEEIMLNDIYDKIDLK